VHTLYNFHFLRTVSSQLVEAIERLQITSLGKDSLEILRAFQQDNHSAQGVYLIHYEGNPSYLGKADNVAERLEQHFFKLSGRKGIDLGAVSYKCILLDESMGTAANEEILIRMFSERHPNMWNGSGFGSKDPGKERDKTRPGKFDQKYPINEMFPVQLYGNQHNLSELLDNAKRQLPYVFRTEKIPDVLLQKRLEVPSTSLSAIDVLQIVVNALGPGWQGTILSFGIILYRKVEDYPYGFAVLPQS